MDMNIGKPEWLTKRINNTESIEETALLLRNLSLHTVCESAECPNMSECFGNKTATFMIMGDVCTRQCRFCAVTKGEPKKLDEQEPVNIGRASMELCLKHIVITSVTRDDIPDGGAEHFANTVLEIRKQNPMSTIELLIPDLQGKWDALRTIINAKPDILNHNLETVPSLYKEVRPHAQYFRSLELLGKVKELKPSIFTKSGIMVGLGETEEEIYQLMDDLREMDCDILTIGQYLRPSMEHIELKEYVHPDTFEEYREAALKKGFKYVASGPFVRSSYNASLGMDKVKVNL